MRLVCFDRHNVGINGVFLDGSTGKIHLKGLWRLKWHRQFNINNPWTKAGGVQPSDWNSSQNLFYNEIERKDRGKAAGQKGSEA